jgi:hypothetical protein
MIKSMRLGWARYVACMGERRNTYRYFLQNLNKKRPSEDPGIRWKDNTKMDLKDMEREGLDYIHMAHNGDQQGTFLE